MKNFWRFNNYLVAAYIALTMFTIVMLIAPDTGIVLRLRLIIPVPLVHVAWIFSTLFCIGYLIARTNEIDYLLEDYFKRKNLKVDDLIEFYKKMAGK